MQKTFIFFVAIVCLISLHACSRCFIEDCAENDFKVINFYSASDSTDLITTGKFLLDSLKITPLKLAENGPEPAYEIVLSNPYLVAVEASNNTAGFVFQLDSLPPDTLLLEIGETKKDKCCKSVVTFESATLNGVALPNGREDLNIPIFK